MGTSLELGQVASFLRTTPSVLRVFAGGLPEQATAWHPGAGKWCMREVIGHLTEEDKRDFIGRIRLMLDQKEPHLPVTEQEEVARMRRDCYKDIDRLLQEFAVVRTESVAFVSELKEAMLDRFGTACSNMALFRKPTVAMTHGPSLSRIISRTSILCSQLSMILPSRLQVFSLSQQLSDLLAERNRVSHWILLGVAELPHDGPVRLWTRDLFRPALVSSIECPCLC